MKDHVEGSFLLFVAFIGAALYFGQHDNFIAAILKGLVWPAYLVYYGLQALGA